MINQKLSSHGESGEPTASFRRVTLEMVRARTIELAIKAGRSPLEIRQSDYEQAKRELTGETDLDRQHAVLYPSSFWRQKPPQLIGK